jgi:hypothetical protein
MTLWASEMLQKTNKQTPWPLVRERTKESFPYHLINILCLTTCVTTSFLFRIHICTEVFRI